MPNTKPALPRNRGNRINSRENMHKLRKTWDYQAIDPTPFFNEGNRSKIPNIPNTGQNRALRPGAALCNMAPRNSKNQVREHPCYAGAMWNGRCKAHGGRRKDNSQTGGPRVGAEVGNFSTGRYSTIMPAHLVQHYLGALNDGDLISLNEEMALLQARLMDLMEGIATDGNERDDTRWKEVRQILQDKRKLADTDLKRRLTTQKLVPVEQVMALVTAIGTSIRTHVHDQEALTALARDFERIVGPTQLPITANTGG